MCQSFNVLTLSIRHVLSSTQKMMCYDGVGSVVRPTGSEIILDFFSNDGFRTSDLKGPFRLNISLYGSFWT